MKQIILFAIPMMIGNLFQELYSVVDTVVVGRILGAHALAAVGAAGAILWMVHGFMLGTMAGCAIFTAQRVGAKDEAGIRRSIATNALIAILMTVILTSVFVPLTRTLLQLMNTPADILDDAVRYLRIIYAGIGATLLYNMLSSTIRALGDSKTPLYFLIFTSVLNVIGDVVLILFFHMGVAGAALATVGSQLISGLACLVYVIRRMPAMHLHREDWKITFRDMYNHIRLGFPMGLQFSLSAIGMIVTQTVLNQFGALAVAGFTVFSRVNSLLLNPMITIGTAFSTFVGQNRGALRFDRIKKGAHQMLFVSVGLAAAMGICVIVFMRPIISLFISLDNEAVVGYAREAIIWPAAGFFILGFLFIYRNGLQGLGDASAALLGAILELAGRALVPILLAGLIGYTAVCIATPISWLLCAIPMMFLYYIRLHRYLRSDLAAEGAAAGKDQESPDAAEA